MRLHTNNHENDNKMSDSGDDWEKQLEDEDELEKQLKKAEEEKKKGTFKDEDAYDSEEERKKSEAEKKAQAASLAASGDAKKKAKPGKDYDLMFEKRLEASRPKAATQQRIEDIKRNTQLSEEAKAQMMQIELERDITESLFADLDVNANSLNQEKDYINFGKKVAGVLYEGQAPYRIPIFFKELVRDLSKQIESKKIKEILDTVTALYNEKVKEEKEKEKSGKGGAGKAKAQLKAGKAHLNQQLVTNLMGEEDDEYGEEDAYKREQEADYDFM